MSEAKKLDGGKLPMHLVPPEVPMALAQVLGPGAKKYGERNWEQGGLSWDRLYGAMQRHLSAAHLFMSTSGKHGEWIDVETGVPHIYCALAELAFAIAYERRGQLDIPKEGRKPGFYLREWADVFERRPICFPQDSPEWRELPRYTSDRPDKVAGSRSAVEDYYEEVK